MFSQETTVKILKLSAQICRLHGDVVGSRNCQDWLGDTEILDSLTSNERDQIMREYEDYNSDGADYEPGVFPYDEMLLSFAAATALDNICAEVEAIE